MTNIVAVCPSCSYQSPAATENRSIDLSVPPWQELARLRSLVRRFASAPLLVRPSR